MKRRILAVMIGGVLMAQGAVGAYPAMATEAANDETVEVSEEAGSTSEAPAADSAEEGSQAEVSAEDTSTEPVPDASPDDEIQYINGIPVDYDDPDCLKYLAMHDTSTPTTFATSTSSYKTTWNGTTYYHKDSVAQDMTISPGIDVSYYQGDINWSKVKSAGVEFAFIRLGKSSVSTGASSMDSKYTTYMPAAKSAGIKVGVYYYSQAITVDEAKKEAQYVLDNLGGYSLDLPIMMDYEYYGSTGRLTSSTPDAATKTEIVQAFCKVIEDAGYTAGVYASKSFFEDDMTVSKVDGTYQIWLAHWTTGPTTYSRDYQYWQCGSSTVSGISGDVDLDWRYYKSTDIVKINGTWTYTVNGTPDYTYTGLAKNSNGWYYIKNGVLDRSYTGFATNENGSWYMESGKLERDENTVIQDTKGALGTKNEWYYVIGSKVQSSFTGLADYKNSSGWWYITKGKVDRSVNTVAKNKNGWYYVVNGKVNRSYNGFGQNSNGSWYAQKGKVTKKVNGVYKDATGALGAKNAWYYVLNSKVQKNFTGLANYKNASGWWYITNGKVDRTYTGIAKNKNGTYYVKNGKVQQGFTGKVTINGKKYSVNHGKVTNSN